MPYVEILLTSRRRKSRIFSVLNVSFIRGLLCKLSATGLACTHNLFFLRKFWGGRDGGGIKVEIRGCEFGILKNPNQ